VAALTPEALAARVAADPDDPTAAAAALVHAYCTRGIPVPAPLVIVKITAALAVRLASNPEALKALSAEGQSVTMPTVGFTFLESMLLNPYRRRTA